MVKKPPCRICRSKRWRKNSLGFYVCEFGHQLEGHQEEEGEFDATIGSTYLRKKNGPKRKRKLKVLTAFSGVSLEDLTLQAVQLTLRKQIHAMIHSLGFPPELEQVAHEYWTLYMAQLESFMDAAYTTNSASQAATVVGTQEEQSESDNESQDEAQNKEGQENDADHNAVATRSRKDDAFKDKAVVEKVAPDALDKMGEYLNHDSDSSSEDEVELDKARLHSDNSEDDDETEGGLMSTSEPVREISRKRRPFKPTRLALHYTIAICYISTQYLKLPVVIGDFYRWVMDRTLPYYNAFDTLPPEMKKRFNSGMRSILIPRHRSTKVFYNSTRSLLQFYQSRYNIPPLMPNIPTLIFRFVRNMMLPVEVYACALRLFHIMYDVFGEPLESKASISSVNARLNTVTTTTAPSYAMAVVIILCKLLFGLDGKNRRETNRLDWINSLPTEQDWIKSLDVFDSLQAQTQVPYLVGEFEDFSKINPDLYSEYSKTDLKKAPEENFRQLLSIFQSTDLGQEQEPSKTGKRAPPKIEAFTKRLFSEVSPPQRHHYNPEVDGPPPLKPAEGYVHYTADSAGVFVGNYERVLGYASNILSLEPETLHRRVEAVEGALFCESSQTFTVLQK